MAVSLSFSEIKMMGGENLGRENGASELEEPMATLW